MKRRDALKSIFALGTAGITVPSLAQMAPPYPKPAGIANRALRIAHLTDMHISEDPAALKGLERCLHQIQCMDDVPDILLIGGDTIEDGLYKTRHQVKCQWDTWRHMLRDHNELPLQYCLGNHDIWGLYNPAKSASYGKNYAMEMMQIDAVYHSFDMAGWHFIVLDSTQKKKNGLWYTAKLDEAQMDWLKKDLAAVPAHVPILVMSHIPILCANVFMDDMQVKYGKFSIPGSWMHTDVQEIMQLFRSYPNVKVCVSGHIHMADMVQYAGISFYCNGAVSGDWWKSDTYKGTKAGYAVMDLFTDGTHTHQYLTY